MGARGVGLVGCDGVGDDGCVVLLADGAAAFSTNTEACAVVAKFCGMVALFEYGACVAKAPLPFSSAPSILDPTFRNVGTTAVAFLLADGAAAFSADTQPCTFDANFRGMAALFKSAACVA